MLSSVFPALMWPADLAGSERGEWWELSRRDKKDSAAVSNVLRLVEGKTTWLECSRGSRTKSSWRCGHWSTDGQGVMQDYT
jgi:hypothetical protein